MKTRHRPLAPLLVVPLLLADVACSTSTEDGDEPFAWTDWADIGDPDVPRPEHPRPDLRREHWHNLNGDWEFRFDPDDAGLTEDWAGTGAVFDRTIIVPFAWNTPASGIGEDTGDDGGIGWYRRTFTVPASFGDAAVHLVVGAADWHTTLWINGEQIAEHENGYLPFRTEISAHLVDGENEVVLRVMDPGNHAEYPHGKQGWPWYTNVGGVWQTVYLEAAAPTWIQQVKLLPDLTAQRFELAVGVTSEPAGCTLQAFAAGQEHALLTAPVDADGTVNGTLDVPWLAPWTPEYPALLDLELHLDCPGGSDAVRTYAGLREVTRAAVAGQDFEAVHLNGEPIYIRGVLDQGFHPDGVYTYPSDTVIREDLEDARDAGYNLVRLHIKVEEPRKLYHADRLGLLVDLDVPNYGIFPGEIGFTPDGRRRWQETMEGMIRRDFNHPSIIWWTLFNEDWGLISLADFELNEEKQAHITAMMARARELDPTRLVEDHSTLNKDHVSGTDLNSFHLYAESPEAFAEALQEWSDGCYPGSGHNFVGDHVQDGAPLINAEYGPFSVEPATPEWVRDRDISWGIRVLTGILRRTPKIVGYVFTQLYDVEFEFNGLTDDDRTWKDYGYQGEITLADLNRADFVGFVEPHFQAVAGEGFAVTPFVSRWSTPAGGTDGGSLRFSLYTEDGQVRAGGVLDADIGLGETKVLGSAQVPAATTVAGAAHILAEWITSDGTVMARNVLPGEIVAAEPPTIECDGDTCTAPIDLSTCTGDLHEESTVEVDGRTEAIGVLAAGTINCEVATPATLQGVSGVGVQLAAELSANVPGAPQTTAGTASGTLDLTIDELALLGLPLPPDQADSRGILSHINGTVPRGAYGDWIEVGGVLPGPLPAGLTITLAGGAGGQGGVMVYGARMGRIGQPAQLVFTRP